MHLKMLSGKWQPLCLSLDVLSPLHGKIDVIYRQDSYNHVTITHPCLNISNSSAKLPWKLVHGWTSNCTPEKRTSVIDYPFQNYGNKTGPRYLVSKYINRGHCMMTLSNGNIFRVTGPLCGEFSGHLSIPLTKASDAEFWCFLWCVSEYTVE